MNHRIAAMQLVVWQFGLGRLGYRGNSRDAALDQQVGQCSNQPLTASWKLPRQNETVGSWNKVT